MKLYIWQGNGISDAYHNDGTLVVLAESPEHARQLVRQEQVNAAEFYTIDEPRRKGQWKSERDRMIAAGVPHYGGNFWDTPLGKEIAAEREAMDANAPYFSGWDGTDEALDREPDRVMDLVPGVIAFNGGGYD